MMNPKRFLLIGGPTLITIGILGIIGWLQQISPASIFNPPYWINWVHLTLGIVVLSIAINDNRKAQKIMTVIAAVLGTALGLFGLLFGGYLADLYNIAEFRDPSDHFLHLCVGILAIWGLTGLKSKK